MLLPCRDPKIFSDFRFGYTDIEQCSAASHAAAYVEQLAKVTDERFRPAPGWRKTGQERNFDELLEGILGASSLLTLATTKTESSRRANAASGRRWAAYESFIHAHGEELPLEKYTLENLAACHWRMIDLSVLCNVLMAVRHMCKRGTSLLVLEVGGGVGIFAEAIFHHFYNNVRYVLVDAVPTCMGLASAYLRSSLSLPLVKTGGPTLGLDAMHRCRILPVWEMEKMLPESLTFDLFVNTESFQEMDQCHVDYYLEQFDQRAHDGSIVYCSNSRRHLFRGSWNFPDNWELLDTVRTPHAWTQDHPSLVFRINK